MDKSKKHPQGETVNGFGIIATFPIQSEPGTRAGRVILVDRDAGADAPTYERYVVSRQYVDNDGAWMQCWDQGSYFTKAAHATAAFLALVDRHAPRLPDGSK